MRLTRTYKPNLENDIHVRELAAYDAPSAACLAAAAEKRARRAARNVRWARAAGLLP